MINIIVASILIPLAVILASTLLLLFIFNKACHQLQTLLKHAQEWVSSQREDALGAVLKRAAKLAPATHKSKATFGQLDVLHHDFTNHLLHVRHLTKKFRGEVNKIKFSTRGAKLTYQQLEQTYPRLDQMEARFHNLAQQVMVQDEMLRREFSFYQTHLREVSNLCATKRVLLEMIAKPIHNFNDAIKHLEQKFENVIDQGDAMQATILTQQYIHKLVTFAKIVTHGPAIAMQIKVQIPKLVSKLGQLYSSQQQTTGLPLLLNNHGFQTILNNLARQLQRAKKHFFALELEKAITKIKVILMGLQTLENQIHLEVQARTIFKHVQTRIVVAEQATRKQWATINQQFKTIVGAGTRLHGELMASYHHVLTTMNGLRKHASNYQVVVQDYQSPYSHRIHQVALFITTLQKSTRQINALVGQMWAIDGANAMVKNKFVRAERALHDMVALVRKENVILGRQEHRQVQAVLAHKAALARMLQGHLDDHIQSEVNTFSNKTTKLYGLLAGKVQMAFHIKNIIKACSASRAMNSKLNLGLKLVETKYLEGDYITGLNTGIECIKKTHAF